MEMTEQRPDPERTGSSNEAAHSAAVTRVRHEAKIRTLSVRRVAHIAPRIIRIIFGGEDLAGFVSLGFDDHVKLFIPPPGVKEPVLPTMGPGGPVFPEGAPRPTMRDFTPRKYDAAAGELTIEFALHDAGPATAWASNARPGDSLAVGGPRGSMIIPLDLFPRHILIGDETALPAIARRLEELPKDSRATVFAEVDKPGDELTLTSAADLDVTWAYRQEAGSISALLEAVRSADLEGDGAYAWIACETSAAKLLRSHLVGERGFHPKRVKAAGYWRRGSVAVHDVLDD
jgi:NADPH-dependent ferric siderophore reductase